MRPFLPPSLATVARGGDALALRIAAEQEQFRAAFAAGRAEGLAQGLAQGRAEGAADGLAAGLVQAQAEFAARERDGLEAANAALAGLLARRAEDRRAMDAEARAALAAVLGVLAPALLPTTLGAELTALVTEALERHGGDTITLRAHPATLALLHHGGPFDAAASLELQPDPELPPGVAEAAWRSGGLVFDGAALLARALAILGAAPPAAPFQEHSP